MLELNYSRLLEALGLALKGQRVNWREALPEQEWIALFQLAQAHHVLPLIYEAVYDCPAARKADPRMMAAYKGRTVQTAMLQMIKNAELLQLLRHLGSAGMQPLIVKGLVCRQLYPKPDLRFSGDEDLLIEQEQALRCHEAMVSYGMQSSDPQQNIEQAYEVPYGKPGSPIYIELHRKLFPPESEAYGDLNRFFEDVFDRKIQIEVQGTCVSTLCATDHLLYLLCHAFKHFLHSGFGIRQVCDIVLFSNRYGQEIDWMQVLERCRAIRAERFAAALYRIGEKHLGFEADAAGYPPAWRALQVDEEDLLEDLLEGGVYGDSSMSRKHSSSMTLGAFSDSRRGKKGAFTMIRSAFPAARELEKRYPYLKTRPWLLPAAWVQRVYRYGREIQRDQNNSLAESVRIARKRIDLMRRYGIIE